jgi:hypothetical protein
MFSMSISTICSMLAEAFELPISADGCFLQIWGLRELELSMREVARIAFHALPLFEQHTHLSMII